MSRLLTHVGDELGALPHRVQLCCAVLRSFCGCSALVMLLPKNAKRCNLQLRWFVTHPDGIRQARIESRYGLAPSCSRVRLDMMLVGYYCRCSVSACFHSMCSSLACVLIHRNPLSASLKRMQNQIRFDAGLGVGYPDTSRWKASLQLPPTVSAALPPTRLRVRLLVAPTLASIGAPAKARFGGALYLGQQWALSSPGCPAFCASCASAMLGSGET